MLQTIQKAGELLALFGQMYGRDVDPLGLLASTPVRLKPVGG